MQIALSPVTYTVGVSLYHLPGQHQLLHTNLFERKPTGVYVLFRFIRFLIGMPIDDWESDPKHAKLKKIATSGHSNHNRVVEDSPIIIILQEYMRNDVYIFVRLSILGRFYSSTIMMYIRNCDNAGSIDYWLLSGPLREVSLGYPQWLRLIPRVMHEWICTSVIIYSERWCKEVVGIYIYKKIVWNTITAKRFK